MSGLEREQEEVREELERCREERDGATGLLQQRGEEVALALRRVEEEEARRKEEEAEREEEVARREEEEARREEELHQARKVLQETQRAKEEEKKRWEDFHLITVFATIFF